MHFGEQQLDQFVSWPTTLHLKRRDACNPDISRIVLVSRRSVRGFVNGVLCNDHKIELTRNSAFEGDADRPVVLLNPTHAVVEKCFNPTVDFVEDRCCQFSAWKACMAASSPPEKRIDREPDYVLSSIFTDRVEQDDAVER
jgi:hypothetical protein